MKKRGLRGLLLLLLLLLVASFMSCPTDVDPGTNNGDPNGPGVDPDPGPEPYVPVAIGNYSGTGTGVASGFARTPAYAMEHGPLGQFITVTVTMADGWITDVQILGPDETPTLGGQLVASLGPIIKENNTFDVDRIGGVEGISGATFTFEGVKEAGKEAIEEIKNSQ
jgi:hypothetical protein